jgi:uncharacterized membrane protein
MDWSRCGFSRGESLTATDEILRWVLLVLCAAGIVVAGYLSYVHLSNKVVYCANYSGCQLVALSEYSTMFGVPIALGGLALYLALMGLLVLEMRKPALRWVRVAFFMLAFAGFVYSLYLTYLELFVILSICLWCLSSAIILTLMALLGGFRLLWRPEFRTGG